MKATFLKADMPLRKRFDKKGKHSYPNAHNFTSETYEVEDMEDFHDLMVEMAADGYCLLKGNTTRDLNDEPRAGTTDRDAFTDLICLDCDGMDGIETPDQFVSLMGLAGVDYITQWSSSAYLALDGEVDKRFNAHIFMQLDEPVSPHQLKLWLKQMNFDVFQQSLELTASDVALRYGLDITTCQNDKLLYIAPPDVRRPYKDTLGPDKRITYHRGERRKIKTAELGLHALDPDKIRRKELGIINKLRAQKGLDKRHGASLKLKGKNVQYLANPSEGKITGIKEDRGFVYFNLNGGDSWGYFHPADNCEYIFNFKGEPTYLTRELLPEYYQARLREVGVEKAGGRIPVAFRGMQDGAMYNGFYDPDNDELELYMARSSKDAINFMAEYGIEIDMLQTYKLVHDPHSTAERIDTQEKTVNMFRVSKLERDCWWDTKPTPIIDRIITHVVGKENVNNFINWLAYIVQYKDATGTAWVMHGSQGTGKGVLYHRVLRHIIGPGNTAQMRIANFEDRYNGFMEGKTLVCIDEVNVPESYKEKAISADLKNYITEDTITIRKMYSNPYEVLNRVNLLIYSNMRNPVIVEATDRRYNISDCQEEKIQLNAEDIEAIDDELTAFMLQLVMYPVDVRQARTASITKAKLDMQALSETSVDQVARALIKGDIKLLHSFSEDEDDITDIDVKILQREYNDIVKAVICDGKSRFSRGELRTIFEACVGRVPQSPAKFTKYLKHHGIDVGLNKIDGVPQRGSLVVEWQVDEDWLVKAQRSYGVMRTVPNETDTAVSTDDGADSAETA